MWEDFKNRARDQLLTAVFDHLLTGTTAAGIILITVNLFYPHHYNDITTIVSTWLVAKKG